MSEQTKVNVHERIRELKELHIQSKPELKKYTSNCQKAIKSRSVPQMAFLLNNESLLNGYNWVIDELFEHIEKLQDATESLYQLTQRGELSSFDISLADQVVKELRGE